VWSQTDDIAVLGTPVSFSQAILVSDDWTISVNAIDANGVPSNPVYTFRVARQV